MHIQWADMFIRDRVAVVLLPSNTFKLLMEDPKVFPGCYVVNPAGSGSLPASPPGGS